MSSAQMNSSIKQKSLTLYVKSKRKLCMYVCNKQIIFSCFVRGWIKFMFWIILVSQLSVQPLSTIIPINRDYTVLFMLRQQNTGQNHNSQISNMASKVSQNYIHEGIKSKLISNNRCCHSVKSVYTLVCCLKTERWKYLCIWYCLFFTPI